MQSSLFPGLPYSIFEKKEEVAYEKTDQDRIFMFFAAWTVLRHTGVGCSGRKQRTGGSFCGKENEILAEETPGQEQQEVLPSEEWETVGEIQEKEEIPASEPETETAAEEEAETQTEPKEEKS